MLLEYGCSSGKLGKNDSDPEMADNWQVNHCRLSIFSVFLHVTGNEGQLLWTYCPTVALLLLCLEDSMICFVSVRLVNEWEENSYSKMFCWISLATLLFTINLCWSYWSRWDLSRRMLHTMKISLWWLYCRRACFHKFHLLSYWHLWEVCSSTLLTIVERWAIDLDLEGVVCPLGQDTFSSKDLITHGFHQYRMASARASFSWWLWSM